MVGCDPTSVGMMMIAVAAGVHEALKSAYANHTTADDMDFMATVISWDCTPCGVRVDGPKKADQTSSRPDHQF